MVLSVISATENAKWSLEKSSRILGKYLRVCISLRMILRGPK